jgi:hypothetical protein
MASKKIKKNTVAGGPVALKFQILDSKSINLFNLLIVSQRFH